MDATSQKKVVAAGFTIIRKDDQPKIRIKFKDKDFNDWCTWQNFETKAARDREYKRLLNFEMWIAD